MWEIKQNVCKACSICFVSCVQQETKCIIITINTHLFMSWRQYSQEDLSVEFSLVTLSAKLSEQASSSLALKSRERCQEIIPNGPFRTKSVGSQRRCIVIKKCVIEKPSAAPSTTTQHYNKFLKSHQNKILRTRQEQRRRFFPWGNNIWDVGDCRRNFGLFGRCAQHCHLHHLLL